jgi:hypothetical protein
MGRSKAASRRRRQQRARLRERHQHHVLVGHDITLAVETPAGARRDVVLRAGEVAGLTPRQLLQALGRALGAASAQLALEARIAAVGPDGGAR